ncbi:hypothetical protein NX784_00165 [Massilia pinisoli]|uniref:Uncharacterized protein n=1 Tax=Massilia pinisoli TaxID=1772194 RepID=A0ABT1ZJB6_9BURK|nr:hypothetical protein [Massilia pinisoli]MCS0579995.1 hypothetical protein [Massilia pinisoli]
MVHDDPHRKNRTMSYDLMVFAPDVAPAKRPAFLDWYDAQTAWDEGHGYDDPAVAAPALQAFYADLAAEFPPAPADVPEPTPESGTDYTIGRALIYMSFLDWDKIDAAWEAVHRLAAKHELGFFDVSSDLAEVWLPDRKGGLRVAHSD